MTNNSRSSWDLCTFLRTLTYFEVFPTLNWIQQWFPTNSPASENSFTGVSNMGVILVAGATGGVGKRVVRRSREEDIKYAL